MPTSTSKGPSASFTLRSARDEDAAAVAALANALNAHEGKRVTVFTPERIRRDGLGADAAFNILVAERDNTLVGYAFFTSVYNTDLAERGLWLDDLFVVEEARGAGIGRALFAAVAHEALLRGTPSVWWGVRTDNVRARAFYARLGARDENARILELDGAALAALAAEDRRVQATPRVLRGARVTLRPVIEHDAEPLAAILAEPAVARWWPDYDVESVREDLIASAPDTQVFAIEVEGELAGVIQAYFQVDPMYRHAGMDLFVATRWQRRGVGTDAIRTLATHLFEGLGHHRIVIDPAGNNEAALQTYARLGFVRVGVLRRYECGADGTWHDGVLMELLRGELR